MRINLFGNTLLLIATLLFAAHTIAAAIYAGSDKSFAYAYHDMGYSLDVWAWIALIVGFLSVTWDFWPRFWAYVTTAMEAEQPAETTSSEQQ